MKRCDESERERRGKGRGCLISFNNVFADVQNSRKSSHEVFNQWMSHCITHTHKQLYKGNNYQILASNVERNKGLSGGFGVT